MDSLQLVLFVSVCAILSWTKADDAAKCAALSESKGHPAAVAGPGLCFLAVNRLMRWSKAVEECRETYGGRLAIVDNDEKMDIIYDMYKQPKDDTGKVQDQMRMWVGLYQINSDDEPAGNWYWMDADGETTLNPAENIPWHPVEPNDTTKSQQCGNVWQAKGQGRGGFGLEDVPCGGNIVWEYICEVQV